MLNFHFDSNSRLTVQLPAVPDKAAKMAAYPLVNVAVGRQLVRRQCERRRLRGGVPAESAGSCSC